MKRERVWYECDYCGEDLTKAGLVNNEGYGGIMDDCFYSQAANVIDICDDPKCYQFHLQSVIEKMKINDGLLLYPLDIENDETGLEYEILKDGRIKVRWNTEDKWHTYKRETLIKLVIPLYEKHCITGNEKYIEQ